MDRKRESGNKTIEHSGGDSHQRAFPFAAVLAEIGFQRHGSELFYYWLGISVSGGAAKTDVPAGLPFVTDITSLRRNAAHGYTQVLPIAGVAEKHNGGLPLFIGFYIRIPVKRAAQVGGRRHVGTAIIGMIECFGLGISCYNASVFTTPATVQVMIGTGIYENGILNIAGGIGGCLRGRYEPQP